GKPTVAPGPRQARAACHTCTLRWYTSRTLQMVAGGSRRLGSIYKHAAGAGSCQRSRCGPIICVVEPVAHHVLRTPIMATMSPGKRLREAVCDSTIPVPGAPNALVGRLAEREGFAAVYLSGAAM